MDDESKLMRADAGRRAAMVAGDPAALAEYLSDDLTWTHSSGAVDTKDSLLDMIASGTTEYLSLETRDVLVQQRGDVFLLSGVLAGRFRRDGEERALENRFLSAWERSGHDRFELLAWQSTGLK